MDGEQSFHICHPVLSILPFRRQGICRLCPGCLRYVLWAAMEHSVSDCALESMQSDMNKFNRQSFLYITQLLTGIAEITWQARS
jgi:hypothetical protein